MNRLLTPKPRYATRVRVDLTCSDADGPKHAYYVLVTDDPHTADEAVEHALDDWDNPTDAHPACCRAVGAFAVHQWEVKA